MEIMEETKSVYQCGLVSSRYMAQMIKGQEKNPTQIKFLINFTF